MNNPFIEIGLTYLNNTKNQDVACIYCDNIIAFKNRVPFVCVHNDFPNVILARILCIDCSESIKYLDREDRDKAIDYCIETLLAIAQKHEPELIAEAQQLYYNSLDSKNELVL